MRTSKIRFFKLHKEMVVFKTEFQEISSFDRLALRMMEDFVSRAPHKSGAGRLCGTTCITSVEFSREKVF